MTPVLTLSRQQFVSRFASLFHRGGSAQPLSPEPFGPPLDFCPACLIDDSSNKVVTSYKQLWDHVSRHSRRLW